MINNNNHSRFSHRQQGPLRKSSSPCVTLWVEPINQCCGFANPPGGTFSWIAAFLRIEILQSANPLSVSTPDIAVTFCRISKIMVPLNLAYFSALVEVCGAFFHNYCEINKWILFRIEWLCLSRNWQLHHRQVASKELPSVSAAKMLQSRHVTGKWAGFIWCLQSAKLKIFLIHLSLAWCFIFSVRCFSSHVSLL